MLFEYSTRREAQIKECPGLCSFHFDEKRKTKQRSSLFVVDQI